MFLKDNPNLPKVFSPSGKFIYKSYPPSREWNDFIMPESLLKDPRFPKTLIPFLILNNKLIKCPRLKNKVTIKRIIQHFKISDEAFRLRNIQLQKYNLGYWERYRIGIQNFYRWIPPKNNAQYKTFLPFWESYNLPNYSPLSLKAQIVFSWIYKHCTEYNHFRLRVSNDHIAKQLNYSLISVKNALKELQKEHLVSLIYYNKNPLVNIHTKNTEIKTWRAIQLTDPVIQKRIQLNPKHIIQTTKQAVKRDCIHCFLFSTNIPSLALSTVSRVAVFTQKIFSTPNTLFQKEIQKTISINTVYNYFYNKKHIKNLYNIIKNFIIPTNNNKNLLPKKHPQIKYIKERKKNTYIYRVFNNIKKKVQEERPMDDEESLKEKDINLEKFRENDFLNIADFLTPADSVLEEEIQAISTHLKNKRVGQKSSYFEDSPMSVFDYNNRLRKSPIKVKLPWDEDLSEAPSVFDYYPLENNPPNNEEIENS